MNPRFRSPILLASILVLSLVYSVDVRADDDAQLLRKLDSLKQEIEQTIQGTEQSPAVERSQTATQTPAEQPKITVKADDLGSAHTHSEQEQTATLLPSAAVSTGDHKTTETPKTSKAKSENDAKIVDHQQADSSETQPKVVEINPDALIPAPVSEGDVSARQQQMLDSVGTDKSDELCRAARRGDTDRVKKLLGYGVNPNVKDHDGSTPLSEAVSGGFLETARVLIQNGADVNAKGFLGGTPLISAAAGGYREIVELLLSSGADVHARTSAGLTALNRAEKKGFEEIAAILRKADLSLTTHPQENLR